MSKHIALMVQSFGAELAVPHLRRFNARCVVEGLNPAAAISTLFAILLTTLVMILASSRETVEGRRFILSPSTSLKR